MHTIYVAFLMVVKMVAAYSQSLNYKVLGETVLKNIYSVVNSTYSKAVSSGPLFIHATVTWY